MSNDVLITPASRKIEFKDSSANVDAKIETDASGNLVITNTGGDISIGDTTSDIFVGDGTNNIDIVFEQDGEIRGTTGVTVTLGQSDSNIRMATDLNLNSNDITNVGDLTITGNLTVSGTTTTLETATLNVEDKNITLNYGSGDTSGSANGAGITIQDGVNSTTDATILWDAGNDEFDISHPVKVAGSIGVTNIVTNKVVKYNGTILDDSNITDTGSLITLGSNTTVSGVLQAGAGSNHISTSAAPFRWQRSSSGQTGQDDNVSVYVDDSNIYFTHNNDDDGDASGFNFRYTTGGVATNLLNFNSSTMTYKGQTVFHDGYHPNADTWTTARTITLGGDLTGNVSINGSSNVTLTAAVVDDSHNHIISNVDGLQTALDGKLPLAGGTMTGTLTMGGNTITGSNFNISGVNALTINDPGEGIIFTGTNNVSLYAVDDAADNIMKFDGAAKLLVNNDRALVSSERDLATNSTGTTSTDFVTVYTVNGNNLASHVRLSVTGTTGNVVVSCVADILCNHSGDIFISSMSGNYSQLDIKVTSNGNEDFAIECKRTDAQTSQATLRYSLVALSQDTTITQASSHSYSTTTLTHRTKPGTYQSATDGADDAYFADIRVGNYIYHDGDTDTSIKFDTNRVRIFDGGGTYLDTNNGSAVLHNGTTFGGDVSGTYSALVVADDSHNHVISNVDGLQTALDGKLSTTGTAANATLFDNMDSTRFIFGSNTSGTNEASVTDWNSPTKTGFYSDDAASNKWSTANWSSIMHIKLYDNNNNYASQLGFDTYQPDLYYRMNNAGTWTSWYEIYHEGHKPTYSELGTMAYSNLTGTPTIPTNNNQLTNGAGYITGNQTITLSGDVSGSGTTSISVSVNDDSHFHHRLDSTDDRDMKPNTSGITSGVQALKPFFSTFGGMTGTANTTYLDVLAFDTYSDSSGGGPSAITFHKGASAGDPQMYIWKAGWAATTWSTGQRVFADNYHPNADTWTTARTITLGGDLTGNVSINGSANVTLTAAVVDDSHNHVISNVDGLQTALDAKLASSSYTASDVLTKIKTVDGSGSGLDADLLDGISSGSFLRSDASDTFTGTLTLNGQLDLSSTDTAANYIHMPRGGGITLYGDTSVHHGIFSRNQSNAVADDILISSYGAVYIDLDSNSNNSDAADFVIGRHNTTSQNFFSVDGENGNVNIAYDNAVLQFGTPGNGANVNGCWASLEGNTDTSGEGSGRLFFREHNSTTGSMDAYGMSLGYRGGATAVTTAGGNSWDGLAAIGNGEWGMWGHNGDNTGALIMSGDRVASYISFANNSLQDIGSAYFNEYLYHNGDTNTYIRVQEDSWTFRTGGGDRFIINNTLNYSQVPLEIKCEGGNTATDGGRFLSVAYSGSNRIATMSSQYSSGNLCIGNGLAYDQGQTGLVSTFANFSRARSGVLVNGGSVQMVGTSGAQQTTVDSAVTAPVRHTFDTTNGNYTAAGDVVAYSDKRLKDDVKVIDNAIEKIQQIRGVTFTRNDLEEDKRHAGVIAQEVEKVLPEVVRQDEDTDIKTVAYGNMVGLLIEAIKEQQETIEKLTSRINDIEKGE